MPGVLLCDECRQRAFALDPRLSCPRCAAPFGALVCTECWERSFAFASACALGELSGPLHRAVLLYKDASERRLGALLGELLGEHLLSLWPGWAATVTWIPPSRSSLARRGFDHGGELAEAVAARLDLEPVPLLLRSQAADQRLLGRLARADNVAGAFSAAGAPPERVLIVDDVMTTGATLDSAAAALLGAGAAEVRVAVVARTW